MRITNKVELTKSSASPPSQMVEDPGSGGFYLLHTFLYLVLSKVSTLAGVEAPLKKGWCGWTASREIEKRTQEYPLPLSRITTEKLELTSRAKSKTKKSKFEQLRANHELLCEHLRNLKESSVFFKQEMQYNRCFFIVHCPTCDNAGLQEPLQESSNWMEC